MSETVQLDTSTESTSQNGHSDEWLEFDDDLAFISHIFAQEATEEIVAIPEWRTKVLCRALNAEDRIRCQMAAYDKESKITDFRRAVYEILMAGCFNPKTKRKVFTESHRNKIMRDPNNGAPVERLFVTILRLSSMLSTSVEQARKN